MPSNKKARDPGDAWPWTLPLRDPGDAFPWKPVGFAGFSKASPGWYAWLDTMPPGPNHLHVVGDVLVSNPGVLAVLTMREPQGTNPKILILDLSLVQQPGMWPAVMSHAQSRFDRFLPSGPSPYQSVEVYLGATKIVTIDHIQIVS